MTVHGSFVEWVEKDIQPLKGKYPTWRRLDGETAGGNRTVVGAFRHAGLKWVVHGDSQFDPILRAYSAITKGQVPDPFIIKNAKVRKCLDFVPALRTGKQHKLFYAYCSQ